MIDGKEFTSENPQVVIDGRTYLPLRAIGEALGVGVEWNTELSRVEISNDSTSSQQVAAQKTGKLTLGDTITCDGFDVTFNQPISWTKIDKEYNDLNGRDVVKIPITIKNNNDETGSLSSFYYECFNPMGVESEDLFF